MRISDLFVCIAANENITEKQACYEVVREILSVRKNLALENDTNDLFSERGYAKVIDYLTESEQKEYINYLEKIKDEFGSVETETEETDSAYGTDVQCIDDDSDPYLDYFQANFSATRWMIGANAVLIIGNMLLTLYFGTKLLTK
jgi:hypothetical protein